MSAQCGQRRPDNGQIGHGVSVHERKQVPHEVARLAMAQSGVLARAQIRGLLPDNVVDRLISHGLWGRLERGIYLVPNVEPDWFAQVWAGVLIGGEQARAGGRTAAALHGLADERQLPLEILVPNGNVPRTRHWVVFRQERDGVRASSTRAEPPMTRIEDTVLDLCVAGTAESSVDWVTKAVQRRLTTPDALLRSLRARPRMPSRKLLEDLLADVAAGVHSTLEHRYLHGVERAHGLPKGVRQRRRPGGTGFIDVVYEECALVVELDGRIGHVGEGRFRDRRRDNSHTRSGLRTLRFGWHEVDGEPCAVALEVAEVLIGLGWSGYPSKCGQCG